MCIKNLCNKKKGFTLVETIACALILSVVLLGVLSSVNYVKQTQATTRNKTYMSLHQVNVIEELRQMALNGKLLAFYDSSKFSTNDFNTIVRVEQSNLGDFTIYRVKIETEIKDSGDYMNNVFTLTDIGEVEQEESLDD